VQKASDRAFVTLSTTYALLSPSIALRTAFTVT